MLINALLSFLAESLAALLLPLRMELLPLEVELKIAAFIGYIASAVGILAEYTHFAYLLALLGVAIAVDIVHTLYLALMWVLRKIPILSIR